MSFIKCQWWSQDFRHSPDGNLSRVDPVQSRIKSIIITASSIVSLRSHQQQSQQVASNQHRASFIVSLRSHQQQSPCPCSRISSTPHVPAVASAAPPCPAVASAAPPCPCGSINIEQAYSIVCPCGLSRTKIRSSAAGVDL